MVSYRGFPAVARVVAPLLLLGNFNVLETAASYDDFKPDFVQILKSMEAVDRNFEYEENLWNSKLENPEKFTPKDMMAYSKRATHTSRGAEIVQHFMRQAIKHEKGERVKRDTNSGGFESQARIAISDTWHPDFVKDLMELSGCRANDKPEDCSKLEQGASKCTNYRTASGICNNLDNKFYGSGHQQFERWLPAIYEDGIEQPLGWDNTKLYNGCPLPLVRDVSNLLMKITTLTTEALNDKKLTYFSMLLGQYMDHDMTEAPLSSAKEDDPTNGLSSLFIADLGTDCNNLCLQESPCFPITLREDDPKYNKPRKCLPFKRSAPMCGTGTTLNNFPGVGLGLIREQLNEVTPFWDANTVYGSVQNTTDFLRNKKGQGLMKVHPKYKDTDGRAYLIESGKGPCRQSPEREKSGDHITCWYAGDNRSPEHLTLSAMHTLMLREHNRIALKLGAINKHWGDETLFQETRQIVIAIHQKIYISEYYPAILGEDAPEYTDYNPDINPAISSVFATAAFRAAHATIPDLVERLGSDFKEHTQYMTLFLRDTFFAPWRIVDEGGLDPIMRGMVAGASKDAERLNLMSDEVRQRLLFGMTGKGMSSIGGFDLASLNLQRGRDHGIPLYNAWRKFCNLPEYETFAEFSAGELGSIPSPERAVLVASLEKLYGHPSNMDMFLAGLLEKKEPNSTLGAVNKCIVKKQFLNLRDGDRFWYERNTNTASENPFTLLQRQEIEKVSLSSVICKNTGLRQIQPHALLIEDRVDCSDIPEMSFESWRESAPRECAGDLMLTMISNKELDKTNVSFQICKSNPMKMIISCRNPTDILTGPNEGVCNPATGEIDYTGTSVPVCTKAPCDTGFHHNGDNCDVNQCECDNGTAVDQALCKKHGANQCDSCATGHHQNGDNCDANQCVCDNGNAVRHSLCKKHGANQCDSCVTGFHLNTRNKCVVNEKEDSKIDKLKKKVRNDRNKKIEELQNRKNELQRELNNASRFRRPAIKVKLRVVKTELKALQAAARLHG